MALPQRLSFVTIGARDVDRLRRFYGGWGWSESPNGTAEYASYELGRVRLALYDLELLRREAAPDEVAPPSGAWNGITLALNLESRDEVVDAVHAAVAAGALLVASPVERDWGGFSGYVADPDGTRWEIAYAPT